MSSLFRGRESSLRSFDALERDTLPSRLEGSIFNRPLGDRSYVQLYLISPVSREDAIIRPMMYNLGRETLNVISDSLLAARHDSIRSISGSIRDKYHLLGDRNADLALLPGQAHRFSRRLINDLWYVILVVNNAPMQSRTGRYGGNKNQLIYTGYALDEPVSLSGRLNLDCDIIFTHMSQMDIKEQAGPDGYENWTRPRLDIDIISPEVCNLDRSEYDRRYLLAPDRIMDAIGPDDSRYEAPYTITDQSLCTLDHMDNSATEMSTFNSPRKQFNRVISALTNTMLEFDNSPSRSLVGGDYQSVMINDKLGVRHTFKNFLQAQHANRYIGPDYRKPRLSINKLVSLYPNLEDNTQVIDLPRSLDIDQIDEEGVGLLPIMSAFIKSSLPSVFSDHGLSDIIFRYATSDPRDRFKPADDQLPVWDIIDVKPYLEEPIEHTRQRVDLCLDHMVKYVFSVVENISGEIEVLVKHSATYDTLVQLQLRDQTDEINDGFAISQNGLGGIISPNLGDDDAFKNHNETLSSLVEVIDDHITHDPWMR